MYVKNTSVTHRWLPEVKQEMQSLPLDALVRVQLDFFTLLTLHPQATPGAVPGALLAVIVPCNWLYSCTICVFPRWWSSFLATFSVLGWSSMFLGLSCLQPPRHAVRLCSTSNQDPCKEAIWVEALNTGSPKTQTCLIPWEVLWDDPNPSPTH